MRRLISVGIAVLFLAAACGLLGGGRNTPPPPGRRDYTWTVDTLANEPGGFIYDIWGPSPDDIWAGSPSGVHRLWHFNGKKWTPWPHAQQISPGFNVTCLYGFARNDVWAGSGTGELYHFNGKKWSVVFTYTIKGMGQPDFTDIWGTSSDDICAIGRAWPDTAKSVASIRGFLLHYDGRHWKELLVTDFRGQLQQVRVEQENVFIMGTQHTPDTYLLYHYKNGRLDQLASNTSNIRMGNVGSEIYFTMGNKVKLYRRGNFFTVMAISADPGTVVGANGRDRNDVFIYTWEGVMQYNGTNIQYLLRIPKDMPRYPFREILFKKEVFFTVLDADFGVTNLVYHGILPDTINSNN